jgi:hypothetical protein
LRTNEIHIRFLSFLFFSFLLEPKPEKEKPEEIQPVVLERARCTIIEIIMKRFTEPAELIKKYILECNLDFLTLNVLSELSSLFPLKQFESEV